MWDVRTRLIGKVSCSKTCVYVDESNFEREGWQIFNRITLFFSVVAHFSKLVDLNLVIFGLYNILRLQVYAFKIFARTYEDIWLHQFDASFG